MNRDMCDIIEVFKSDYDIDFSIFDESFLLRSINQRIKETKTENHNAYLNFVKSNNQEIVILKKLMNITYTRFFRDSFVFAQLQKIVLPQIIVNCNQQKEIRIWSAGSSGGQEAYSIAILILELEEEAGIRIPFRIIATDISGAMLKKAKMGKYKKSEILNLKLKHIEKYFTNKGDEFIVNDILMEKVSFSYFDLVDATSEKPPESIYGDFDLVLCNNLLFYYNEDIQKRIILKISSSLSSNGYFVTSETEKALISDFSNLAKINVNSSIFKIKK